jgi:WD40 repeat protein
MPIISGSISMAEHSIYTTGGTVQAGGGIYLARQADAELLELCQAGAFVYILTPRQMGKSSLMVRTAAQVNQVGHRAAMIDLTQLGVQVTAEQWYLGFLAIIEEQLELATDVVQWWQARTHLGFTQRMTQFFKEVLLAEVAEPVVIFVDEIDSTLSLDFTDDFFAAIRYLYVARAQEPVFQRLSFVLIGVATPSDLIRDPKRTPFNVGQRVDLTDFTLAEAMPLAAGLGLPEPEAEQVLGWVLKWTGGHPYLTQRLCGALVDQPPNPWSEAALEQVVTSTFLGRMSEQDNNLQFVRDMLTKRAPHPLEQAVLETYRQIHWGKVPVLDEEQNLVKSHLKLSGVVWREGKHLEVRNCIYREVFNRQWIQEHLPESLWQRLKPAMPLLASLLIFSVVTSGLAIYAFAQQRKADKQTQLAQVREQAARTLNLLPTASAAEGLVLAIDTIGRSQSVPEVEVTAQSSLLSAVQMEKEVNRLQGHGDPVRSVAFSPDGKRIVSGSVDETVRLWDAQTGQPVGQPLQGHTGSVNSVAFSPDSRRIASGGDDKTVRLWDAQTGQPIGQPLQGHTDVVSSVAFSPDGKRLVSGSGDKTVRQWDAQTGQPIGQPLQGHTDVVSSVAFSPDGKRLASGSGDKTVRLWDVQMGKPIGQPLRGHRFRVYSVAFSPDGQRLVSGSGDKTVRLWDPQAGRSIGQPLQGHGGAVRSVAFSPDGKRIASGGRDKLVRLWDASTNLSIDQPFQEHTDSFKSVAFSPDGKRIAGGGKDKLMRLWDAQTGQPVGQPLQGHTGSVKSVAFSPDGKRIASGSDDKTIRLWDAQTGKPIGQPFQGHGSSINSVVFSPDSKRIVSGSDDKTVRLWDAQTGKSIGQPLQGDGTAVNSVAFSPDGKRIASSSDDKTVQLWDAQTGQPIDQPLQGHTDPVLSVAFSPDGKHIASGSIDYTVRLWDAQSGRPIGQPLQSDGGPILSIAFSLDSKRIVSGSKGGMVRLWDAHISQPIGQPFQGHEGEVTSVAFSPDGKRIVSGSDDKTVRLWDVSPDAWLAIACNRLQYHPLLNHPETVTTDPEFLKVAQRARAVCQQKVWPNDRPTISQSSSPQFPLVAGLTEAWTSLTKLLHKSIG